MASTNDGQSERIRVNLAGVASSTDWLGPNPGLYRSDLWQRADRIQVARFRQIYIWPLALRLAGLPTTSDEIAPEKLIDIAIGAAREAINQKTELWEEVRDLLDHATRRGTRDQADDAQSYGEFVYFHDFVQAMLFRQPKDGNAEQPALRIYRHKTIEGAEISIGARVFRARVDRCNLYLFRSGAAALAVELDFGAAPHIEENGSERSLSLRDVQDFIDRARRSYTPYHVIDQLGVDHPGQVVDRFAWKTTNGTLGTPSTPNSLEADRAQIAHLDTAKLRSAPMARHWLDILEPLEIAGYERKPLSVRNPVWRHVVDERIPVMSYVSLTGAAEKCGVPVKTAFDSQVPGKIAGMQDLWIVSRGDWIRLAGADESGTDPLPYSHRFLHDFETTTCYDRYFPSDAATSATRYMFTGYHFTAVEAASLGGNDSSDSVIFHHFRRHYFQMGLILHMEFASLLATSSRVSEAVRRLMDDSNEVAFRQTLVEVQRDFLEFVHQFHFTGLSNQLQAREMFEQWRRALGLDALFKDVKTEIESATGFLLSDQQVRQGESANTLSTIASIAVFFGLAFSFLGMNVLVGDNTLAGLLDIKPGGLGFLKQLFPFGVVLAGAGILWYRMLRRLMPAADAETRRRSDKIIVRTIWTGFALGLIGLSCVIWSKLQ